MIIVTHADWIEISQNEWRIRSDKNRRYYAFYQNIFIPPQIFKQIQENNHSCIRYKQEELGKFIATDSGYKIPTYAKYEDSDFEQVEKYLSEIGGIWANNPLYPIYREWGHEKPYSHTKPFEEKAWINDNRKRWQGKTANEIRIMRDYDEDDEPEKLRALAKEIEDTNLGIDVSPLIEMAETEERKLDILRNKQEEEKQRHGAAEIKLRPLVISELEKYPGCYKETTVRFAVDSMYYRGETVEDAVKEAISHNASKKDDPYWSGEDGGFGYCGSGE